MYAYISGTLAEKKPTEAVVEAGGVGYRMLIPASSFDKLPAEGQPARLLTTFVVVRPRQTVAEANGACAHTSSILSWLASSPVLLTQAHPTMRVSSPPHCA